MTREEELDWLYRLRSEIYVYMPKEWVIPMNNALDMAIKALEQQSMPTMVYPQVEGITPVVVEPIPKLPPVNQQEPCGDLISRQAVMDCFKKWQPYMATRLWDFEQELSALPSVKPQEKTGQFVKWVATEIFDEWEYNKDTFAEIACRKLAKLGIVRAKGNEWELVESQESEEV